MIMTDSRAERRGLAIEMSKCNVESQMEDQFLMKIPCWGKLMWIALQLKCIFLLFWQVFWVLVCVKDNILCNYEVLISCKEGLQCSLQHGVWFSNM